jgi:osomolarity two-component system sensor histidine kinase NIK1
LDILLVEDNILNQKVVTFNLKKFNYNVVAVGNGREALDTFANHSFDLILMDLMLPEMNGYEITLEIRKMEKERNIVNPVPIIAITANTLDNDRDKCFEVGMNDYLSKPFTAAQLIDRIRKYIS